ncbi:MAG: nitroreductase [Lachnospiraceae bacterium]|nr:nitroreductase [Lachnospiraceae bacterium]
MNLYEAVYNRKSVRHYKMELLPQEFFRNLRKFEQGLQSFTPEIKHSVELFNAMDGEARIKGLFHVKAPYYMVFFSEPGEYAALNAGYLLEQIVLYMTSRGVGTCYQGMAKTVGLQGPAGMDPVMVVAFGYADEKLHRESFRAKRLPLKELCVFKEDSTEETRLMLQAARLAPSAFNRQPWRFIVYQNRIHVFARKEPIPLRSKEDRIEFDMGIMLSHVTLAAEECWRDVEFARKENLAAREMRSNQYFMSILLA